MGAWGPKRTAQLRGNLAGRVAPLAIVLGAVLISAASVLGTGVRTAEVGRLVEECCACLDQEGCLAEGTSEKDCRLQYHPVGAMFDQLEIPVDRASCVQACPDCATLQDDYGVSFATGTVSHLAPMTRCGEAADRTPA